MSRAGISPAAEKGSLQKAADAKQAVRRGKCHPAGGMPSDGECRPKTLFAGLTRQAAGEFCRNTQVKREVIHLSTRLSTMPAFYAVKKPQKRAVKKGWAKRHSRAKERLYKKRLYKKKAAYNTAEWQKRACPIFIPQSVCRRLRGFGRRRRHRAVVLPADPPQIGIGFKRADTM